MDELIQYFESLLQYAQSSGSRLNQESQQALAQLISQFQEVIEQSSSAPPISAQTPSSNPSNDAQLLWILSGQQPQAFISYLRTFPTAATRQLLGNPEQLNSTIEQLSRMIPPGQPLTVDGIPHADLNSSNVWGANYDLRSGKMRVRFQGGSEYEYDGVPQNIFKAFIKGNASAKTKGKNRYGEWWVGKNPSLGAALNQYIKAGGFPYRKVA